MYHNAQLVFGNGASLTFCPGWHWIVILQVPASWVSDIAYVYHHTWTYLVPLMFSYYSVLRARAFKLDCLDINCTFTLYKLCDLRHIFEPLFLFVVLAIIWLKWKGQLHEVAVRIKKHTVFKEDVKAQYSVHMSTIS
jgi:hypothetical protein